MRIGELAARSGLTASRIRFYEASGLISAVERGANNYREYTPDAVLLLEIITSAQNAGFSLQEIRRLMPPRFDAKFDASHHDELVGALKRKVAEIEALRERLAESLERLHGIIDTIENRPEGLSCGDNAKRVMTRFRKQGASAPKTRRAPRARSS
ncbi:MerR family transcriptional regulator [Bradyrhizobium sp. LTSP849]|uniref:MerR family transcriptional regulator n=1 Tax=Bradyrhizobium sp. LTSP849 TaxID=1615890 RepID=UPI0005D27717|nr:MerR family transcriptional regulator [Bradyrhizobium sp. LTSP849]KJC51529.1 MerR family transcriptional regulator [Bradyrhizobium sp. LTSP849]